MPNPLFEHVRQSAVIVVGTTPSGPPLPPEWNTERVGDAKGLVAAVRAANGTGRRSLILVVEAKLVEVVSWLRTAGLLPFARGGIVAIAAQPDACFARYGKYPELLDTAGEGEWAASPMVVCLRALRQCLRAEELPGAREVNRTIERLNEIFIDLSAERNPQRLLATCLVKAMELTQARGGTLFMVSDNDGEMLFRLKITSDGANQVSFEHLSLKVQENSLCGYVCLTGKPLAIADVSSMRQLALPQFNRAVDYGNAERPYGVITVPLRSSRNEIIAVLQLAEKADGESQRPFDGRDESLLASFATQAAICMENVELYADIQRLFEGFVKAAISAIESRDPSTGGHSERVAKLCVGLARATSDCSVGVYRSVRFREEEVRELEYAALLHDFGKIGVREEVLVKAKKLHPYQLDAIHERIKRIGPAMARIRYLEERLKAGADPQRSEKEYRERLGQLEEYWKMVLSANEPTVLRKDTRDVLERVHAEKVLLPDDSSIALVTEEEFQALCVAQGSLTESERLEIESHVRHTYQFLKMIPWTKDFRHLTEIAYAHHEKLDGTGYPRGLIAHEIPLQSKIMTIADIYDALTAADRWYKEALPPARALEILRQEVDQGKLDPVLFELFAEKKIHELTTPKIAA